MAKSVDRLLSTCSGQNDTAGIDRPFSVYLAMIELVLAESMLYIGDINASLSDLC